MPLPPCTSEEVEILSKSPAGFQHTPRLCPCFHCHFLCPCFHCHFLLHYWCHSPSTQLICLSHCLRHNTQSALGLGWRLRAFQRLCVHSASATWHFSTAFLYA